MDSSSMVKSQAGHIREVTSTLADSDHRAYYDSGMNAAIRHPGGDCRRIEIKSGNPRTTRPHTGNYRCDRRGSRRLSNSRLRKPVSYLFIYVTIYQVIPRDSMPCTDAMARTSIDTGSIRAYLAAKLQFSHGKQADVGSDRINRALQLHGMVEREDGQFGMAADGDFFRRKIDLVAQLPDRVVQAIVQRFAEPCHSLGGASVDVEAKAVEWLRAKQVGPSSQVSTHAT